MTTVSDAASIKRVVIASAAIFIVAFGVRLLSWHDTRREVGKVQTVVAADYQHVARLIQLGGARGFFSPSGALADPNMLGHPPGYPILIAVVWSVFGESNTAIQIFQITCDALAAVLIFLIAIELLPFAVGVIAGLLVAFAPQFSWNSVLLLPDTLAVMPLLLAMYLLTRAFRKPRLLTIVAAGICVGLSCWLRANALFLGPFLAVLILFLFERARRWRYAGAFLAAVVLTIAPLTLRNWIVFQHFIPVSLGAGQTMLEGISDYDPERKFGIPNTDMGIMKLEAEQYNRPDYYSTLFVPDGVKRERMRLARAFDVVRHNPGWFLGVMVRRAASMLRLERARRISPDPPVTNQHADLNESQRVWRATAAELIGSVTERSPAAQFEVTQEGQALQITSSGETYGVQMRTSPIVVQRNRDYVFRIPAVVNRGRFAIKVTGNGSNKEYVSGIVETVEVKEGLQPPTQIVELAFVTGNESVRVDILNAAAASERSVVTVGPAEMFDFGPAKFLWTRYPRLLVNLFQRLFITALMLPLALAGTIILIRRRAIKSLILLLAVPVYYFCFQSLLHTEYRYVLAVHYFLFVLAALTAYEIWRFGLSYVQPRLRSSS